VPQAKVHRKFVSASAETMLTFGSWGIFRLTDPPGMNTVLHCSAPGIFHPHSESNMYTDALRPGHVVEAADLEYRVVDLRP